MKAEAASLLKTSAWALDFYHILLVKASQRQGQIQGKENRLLLLLGRAPWLHGKGSWEKRLLPSLKAICQWHILVEISRRQLNMSLELKGEVSIHLHDFIAK